jgi:hypothetical protein
MNNDEHKISILQKFKRPEQSFIKDKECLICLDPFDLESNQIVKLPCACSNSVYHIGCILLMLNSGQNKNFCPHCKGNYEMPIQQQFVEATQLQNLQIIKITYILIIHILSNSIMNVINIVVARNVFDTNVNEELNVLIFLYFCKLFFNCVIVIYSKNNIDKIADSLFCSYVYQTISFGILIYALTRMKNDSDFSILIVNNVLLCFGDLAIRIHIEYT